MSIIARIRAGEGQYWGTVKRVAKQVLGFHLPAGGVMRPFWRLMYWLHVAIREALIWLRRFFWNEPLFRSQCVTVGSRFRMEELPYMHGEGFLTIGSDVVFSGKPHFAFNNRYDTQPKLQFGDGTFIGHGCQIRVAQSVTIGRNCLLAGGVMIADYDGHPLDAESRRKGQTSNIEAIRPVTICDDVWIGASALVLKGVTIGARSIVGAHSVVTKDIPPDTIVAGNPARAVRQLSQDLLH
jgi:acetyltransferase-like isoleucine patch superfamily enzyme